MSYALIANPTNGTLAQIIVDFATQTLGWTAVGADGVRPPGGDPTISYKLNTSTAAKPLEFRLTISLMSGTTVLQQAITAAPHIANVSQTPTKMHLFGAVGATPFIAAVIEYSPGYFRHVYLGTMEKLGNYTSGEVIAAATVTPYFSAGRYDYDPNQYLFSGLQGCWPAATSGGVRMTHAELGGTILAPFRAQTTRRADNLIVNTAMGGFKDNINDQQIARATNTFAGAQLLVPVNLYLVRPSSRVLPIGRPAGVRMVNMTNLDPSTPIVVGNKTWRCFPQFRKADPTFPTGPNGTGQLAESSWVVGYAYLED
ncbi:virion structural protein [Achromobacter phage vB_AchrS_AchV4]|uniref:Virion structural protein n=1 Tax=Achromobacter phage vB_AchrS_AchV4 TaxID=2796514 RepID=A0A7T3PGW6_9CAUD|nr:virion structural protein [Achromobacter phage vB_AchrS_AchV4]QPZ53255.1 virion structural protein [Achromobacter phage vB_AchrS_AchV4]